MCCVSAQGRNITKCQDAQGNWHYGDFASSACASNAPITQINQEGITVKKEGPPPTEEELEKQKAEREKKQQETRQRAKQRQEDQRLLRTYDSAQSIIDARNERINAMDRDLKNQRLFRKGLVDQKEKVEKAGNSKTRIDSLDEQIEQYDESIESIESQKQATIEEYDRQLKRYRELTE
jgi:carboxypeptidase C (cathepsin A)